MQAAGTLVLPQPTSREKPLQVLLNGSLGGIDGGRNGGRRNGGGVGPIAFHVESEGHLASFQQVTCFVEHQSRPCHGNEVVGHQGHSFARAELESGVVIERESQLTVHSEVRETIGVDPLDHLFRQLSTDTGETSGVAVDQQRPGGASNTSLEWPARAVSHSGRFLDDVDAVELRDLRLRQHDVKILTEHGRETVCGDIFLDVVIDDVSGCLEPVPAFGRHTDVGFVAGDLDDRFDRQALAGENNDFFVGQDRAVSEEEQK